MPLPTDRPTGDDPFAPGADGKRPGRVKALAYRMVCIGHALKGVLGAPDYEAYLAHCKAVHPDVPAMSEEAFFRFAIDRRYNKPGGGMRCC